MTFKSNLMIIRKINKINFVSPPNMETEPWTPVIAGQTRLTFVHFLYKDTLKDIKID